MNNKVKCKNAFFFNNINQIGGIETFFYELAKKYHDYDIVVFYISGDIEQVKRLRQYVKVIQMTNHIVECDRAFFNYNISCIDRFHAKEYYEIIHADYKKQNLIPHKDNRLKYIGVSQAVCDSFTEISKKPCALCYNPITIDKPKRTLTLVTASRLTKEKGKERMIKLGKMLDDAGIPYIWYVFTNDKRVINNPHIVYMTPTLDIHPYLAKADYTVQLSDTESYCYTIVESLALGTPIIACKWPVLEELGIDNKYGFILDFDMNDVPIEEIYTRKFNIDFQPPADNWADFLIPGPSEYTDKNVVDAIVLENFTDKNTGKHWTKGETIYNLPLERAKEINLSPWCVTSGKAILAFSERL